VGKKVLSHRKNGPPAAVSQYLADLLEEPPLILQIDWVDGKQFFELVEEQAFRSIGTRGTPGVRQILVDAARR
jgi:hypothetical protein